MTNSVLQIVQFFVGVGIGLFCQFINIWLKIVEKSAKLCDFYKFFNKFCVFFMGGAAWFVLSIRLNYGALSSIIFLGGVVGFIIFWLLFKPLGRLADNLKNAKTSSKTAKSE